MPIQDRANNLHQSTSIYLNMRQLEARYQVTKTTIYSWIKTRDYPKPIHLGANLVRWNSAQVDAWEAEREVA
jgi:predicted DNA-binding transcriptional regulator AlpA